MYRMLRTVVSTPSTPFTIVPDDRMLILNMYRLDEAMLGADSTSCTFLRDFDFDSGHSFHFGAYLRIKVRKNLPKTAAAATITDSQQFSIGAYPKPGLIDLIPSN
jgi:hypothetical protein